MATPFDPNFPDPVTGEAQSPQLADPLSDINMAPGGVPSGQDPMAFMADQPVPEAPKSFLQQVEEKITAGILGTGIPRVAVSAGLGAVTGAGLGAPLGPIGAVPGALLGAAVGVVSDILGATADVATAKALGPEGVELGFARISPELAGMMADIGVGVLAGGAMLSKVGRILGPTAKRLEAAGLDAALGGIPTSKPHQLTLPKDMSNYFAQHPEAKAVQRAAERRGIGPQWDGLLGPPADMTDEWNKLMKYGPTGADPGTPLGAIKAGLGSVIDSAMNTRLFRFVASPWRALYGDPAAMESLRLMGAGEVMARPMAKSYSDEFASILKPLSAKQQNAILQARFGNQGMSERELEKLASRPDKPAYVDYAAEKIMGKKLATSRYKPDPKEQIPVITDVPPRMTSTQNWAESKQRMEDMLRATKNSDLIDPARKIDALLMEMGQDLVAAKKLDPQDLIPNYFPFIRETAFAERAKLVELPNGYFPVHIESQIKGTPMAFFLNKRRIDVPPKSVTLEGGLGVYTNAYSRVMMNSMIFPRIKELMPMVTPEKADYVASLFNYYVGHPTTHIENVGRSFAEMAKNVQFWRTIGASVLFPLVNTTQRLNILGMTDTESFMKGLIPNRVLRERAKAMGVIGRNELAFADIAASEAVYAGMRKGVRSIHRILGAPAFWSENANKLHAFQAGFYQARKRGLPDAAAEQFGVYTAERSQFMSRIGRTPKFAQNDLGSVVGQFKAFSINQLGFTEQLLRSDPRGAARFMIGTLALFGTDAIAPGADLEFTRRVYEKPFKMFPGLVGYAGAALADQVSMWGFDADDMQRMSTHILGPTFDHLQGIASAITGINLGNGNDFTDFGQPLTPDQRAARISKVIPVGGSQVNRIRQAIKLFQTGEADRAALTLKQAFGAEEAEGPLHQRVSKSEAMMKAMGLTSQRMFELNQLTDLQRQAAEEYRTVQGRISDLRIRGKNAEAQQLLEHFKRRYPEVSHILPSLPSLKEAMERRVKTGARRGLEKAPRAVRQPYEQAIREREL